LIALAALAALASGTAVLRAAGARGAFAWAAGAVVGLGLSGTLWSAGLLLFGATGAGSDLMMLLLAAVLWWRRFGGRPDGEAPGEEKKINFFFAAPAPWWLVAACALAALVVTALFVEHSLRYPDGGWDAVAMWNLRARALFGAPHRLDEVFNRELLRQHPDYPLLLPGLIAHGWFALGTRSALVPIGVSFLFAATGAAALGFAVGDRRGPALGLSAALLLLGTPQFLLLAWNQYADLKLAMLWLVAVVLASGGRFLAAGLVAGLCAYTKNEGLVEFAALLGATVLASGSEKKIIFFSRRPSLRLLAGGALPLALLGYFKLRWAPPNDLMTGAHIADLWRIAPGRSLTVLRGFAGRVVDFPAWGCALPFVVACWIAGWRRRERTLAAVFVALVLAALFAIYLATPLDPAEHIGSSLDRLLFQLWPSIIYATAIALVPAAAPAGAAPPRSAADPA
jgi:hypothetical protein